LLYIGKFPRKVCRRQEIEAAHYSRVRGEGRIRLLCMHKVRGHNVVELSVRGLVYPGLVLMRQHIFSGQIGKPDLVVVVVLFRRGVVGMTEDHIECCFYDSVTLSRKTLALAIANDTGETIKQSCRDRTLLYFPVFRFASCLSLRVKLFHSLPPPPLTDASAQNVSTLFPQFFPATHCPRAPTKSFNNSSLILSRCTRPQFFFFYYSFTVLLQLFLVWKNLVHPDWLGEEL
jgi:hypothetical protein